MTGKEKIASWVLLFLCIAPFLIAAIGVQFLPDQIPVHYNIAGEIDRWGSKYEEFILAAAFSLSGWLLWLMARFSGCFADTDEERVKRRANAKILIWTGIAIQLLFCTLQLIFLVGAFREVQAGAAVSVLPIYKIIGIGTGLLMIVLGNIIPKAKNVDSVLGIRTPWSRSSPEAWAKSQLLGGITFAAAGAICVILSIALHGFAIFWVILGCSLGAALVSCVLSFRVSL